MVNADTQYSIIYCTILVNGIIVQKTHSHRTIIDSVSVLIYNLYEKIYYSFNHPCKSYKPCILNLGRFAKAKMLRKCYEITHTTFKFQL